MAVSQSNYEGMRRALNEWLKPAERILSEDAYALADRWASAVSRWIVDASLLGDTKNLHTALESMRKVFYRLGDNERSKAIVSTLMEVTRAALDRVRQKELEETLDPDSRAARILVFINENSRVFGPSIAQIAERLCFGVGDVSSAISALAGRGLVLSTKHMEARKPVLRWRITPRGKGVVESVLRRKENNIEQPENK